MSVDKMCQTTHYFTLFHYAIVLNVHMLNFIFLNVIILRASGLNVILLILTMLNVIMLSASRLNVIFLILTMLSIIMFKDG
jgi:hypothetical protein